MKIFKGIMNGYNRLLDVICDFGAVLIVVMFLAICLQVFARLLPIPPVLWTTDVAMYIMIILGFLGLGALLRKGAHVSIDVLVNAMPNKAKYTVETITSVVGALSCAVVAYFGILVMVNQIQRGVFVGGSLFNMPRWILTAFIPIGFSFAFIEFIVIISKNVIKIKNSSKE